MKHPASDPLRAAGADRQNGFACVVAAWEAHEAELRGYVRHRLSDRAAADDVVQEVFLKAMNREHALCGVENPRAWLFQVARNALIDRARTTHPTEPIDEHESELLASTEEPLPPVDALASCLASALAQMPPDDAGILRGCDIEGQPQREFAAAHGISIAAAKSRLLRARQRLRDHLVRVCHVRFDVDGTVCCHEPAQPAGAGQSPGA
jgi:RNA polymerase sigma-70 factor (ECF subfamily)